MGTKWVTSNELRAKVDSNGSKIHTERNVVVPVSFFVTYPAPKQQTLHYGYYSPLLLPPPPPYYSPLAAHEGAILRPCSSVRAPAWEVGSTVSYVMEGKTR